MDGWRGWDMPEFELTAEHEEQTTEEFWMPFDDLALESALIKTVMCMKALRGESGQEERRAFFAAKRKAINRALQARRYNGAGPPDQVVGLQPASLQGKSKTRSEMNPIERFLAELLAKLQIQ